MNASVHTTHPQQPPQPPHTAEDLVRKRQGAQVLKVGRLRIQWSACPSP